MINDNDEVQWAYLLDPTFELVNTAGKPLTDGYIEVYIHGTRSKYYCASDFDGTLHPFKIPLDSLGANIVLASPAHAYDVYVYNKFGNLVMSRYNVVPATGDGSVIRDVVTITSEDGTVDVTTSDQTNWDLSIQDTVDRIDEHDIVITELGTAIDAINEDLSTKKDKQTAKSFTGSQTKTITNISQNANGVISVTYEDIDLPPEVPNVEITSEDNSIQIIESTDQQTNTKTFDLSVNVDDSLEYGQFRATNVTGQAQLTKIKGNIDLSNYLIKLKKGNSYHFTVRGSYVANSAANTYNAISYIEYSSFTTIPVNVDNTITNSQFFEISYDVYNYSQNGNYNVSFAAISSGKVSELWVEVHNLNGVSVNGGSGGSYTAGDGIDITSNTISVDAGKGLGFDADGKLEVKVGTGLEIDDNNNVITIDSEVGDVVETVEKLKQDLDTQLTVNFDMGNITHTYDFADSSVTTLSNGATMLCQAFTVPINHDIRITSATEDPTLLGIYAKQPYNTKIMLALYVYDFDTGYTDYVADTGPVTVVAGRNEFPIVHINPNVTELKSSCVYYAALYLPSSHNNGLYLASCPSYTNASYINATPRFTVGVENIQYNNQEIDMTDATTGRLDYNDGQGNYYIGPWSDSYNERPNAPRFFMQLRNGEVDIPVVVDPFDNISSYSVNQVLMSNLFTDASDLGSGIYPVVFRDVTPNTTVEIDWWESFNGDSTESNKFGGMIFDSGFNTIINATGTTTVTEMGSADGLYGHKYTPSSPIILTANTTYRFAVLVGPSDSYNATGLQYSTPTTTCTLHLFQSGWSINEWATYKRLNNVQAIPLVLHDTDGNTWRI